MNTNAFGKKHFDDQLIACSENLVVHIQKNWQLNIFKGNVELWAAAIVYALARYNLLFDKNAENGISPELIIGHFPEDGENIIKRAEKIEYACAFELGESSISADRVRSMINLFITQSGFVIPKLSIDGYIENLKKTNKNEAFWAENKLEELILARKARYMEKLLQISLKKGKQYSKQLDLFNK